jgi:PAS domain S-box-containing protein
LKSVLSLRLAANLVLLSALGAGIVPAGVFAALSVKPVIEHREVTSTSEPSARLLLAVQSNKFPATIQFPARTSQNYWSFAGIRTTWGPAAAFLDVVLFLVILFRLQRNGRYRQTLFAKAFRSSPLGITITTRSEGRYVDVNDAFLQMLNYERRDVIGRTSAELNLWVEPEDRSRMLQQLGDSSIAKGLSTRFRTSSGDIRDANVSAELIDLDNVPCVLAVTQDVTEAKRLENQLRQSQRMGAVGRMAGGVAHDFNNILTVIMGYSELVLHRLGTTHPAAKNLGEIKRAAERAASLTRQLLAFSRQQVLYPRVLDLNAVVINLNQMLHRLIGEDIVLSFQPGDPLGYIKADLGQIEQVLMNLVVNKTLSHIFEPFFTTKGPARGRVSAFQPYMGSLNRATDISGSIANWRRAQLSNCISRCMKKVRRCRRN